MIIVVTLNGTGGPLDYARIDATESDEEVSDMIKSAIAGWTLSAGDTITITEE